MFRRAPAIPTVGPCGQTSVVSPRGTTSTVSVQLARYGVCPRPCTCLGGLCRSFRTRKSICRDSSFLRRCPEIRCMNGISIHCVSKGCRACKLALRDGQRQKVGTWAEDSLNTFVPLHREELQKCCLRSPPIRERRSIRVHCIRNTT